MQPWEQIMKQTISEILDRRLDPQALDTELSAIARDGDACLTWRNYHLIGDVIRGEVAGGSCLLYRVQEAMENEPTVLAPASTGPAVSSSTKSGLSSEAARSAGLFAIAASLTLVAVLTLSPQSSVGPVGATGAQIATVEPVAEAVSTALSQAQANTFESEFGQMLIEHGEFTATSGMNGLIAYAKLVSNQQLAE